jgi:leader peptidase (prepilin peptidase) / N-methyltransferase
MVCIFFAVSGLLLGSFLNVCILRLPAGESIVTPRSHCRHCRQPIANRDNVPLLSWILLGATCRHCGARISWRYPLIELTTCLLFVICCLNFTLPLAAGWAVLCFLLLGLAVMDAETLLLPDLFTLPGLAAGVVFAALHQSLQSGDWNHGWILLGAAWSIFSAAVAAAALLLIAGAYWLVRRREGMGMGDVKLAAMLGAWLGLPLTALTLFLAVILGAVYGLGMIVLKRRKGPQPPAGQLAVPFGTMLSVAGLYSIFLLKDGPQLVQMVMSVHDVKAAPLVHTQRSEQGMNRHPFHAELAPALIQQGVHRSHFFPQKLSQLAAVESRKLVSDRCCFLGRRHTFWQFSEGQDH